MAKRGKTPALEVSKLLIPSPPLLLQGRRQREALTEGTSRTLQDPSTVLRTVPLPQKSGERKFYFVIRSAGPKRVCTSPSTLNPQRS
jgi:hypothetical protein